MADPSSGGKSGLSEYIKACALAIEKYILFNEQRVPTQEECYRLVADWLKTDLYLIEFMRSRESSK